MAISSTAQWEMRASASNSGLQGGFYVTTAGSTDYSQQDTAQLSLTDIATDGAGTGLSSATGGFTSAMIGNGIYITGGGTTAGWYQITARASSNAITIDRSCGASKTNVTGRVGGAILFNPSVAVAGNKMWLKAGSYTFAANQSLTAGTTAGASEIEGYNSTRGDEPTGDNRPSLITGGYVLYLNNFCNLKFCKTTGTSTVVAQTGYFCNVVGSYISNTSATASRVALNFGNSISFAIDCEIVATNGKGANSNYSGTEIVGCYFHDCGEYGAYLTAGSPSLLFNIFDTCAKSIYKGGNAQGFLMFGNTVYGTDIGIEILANYSTRIYNNIFVNCAKAMTVADGHQGDVVEDYNCFYNNTIDRENILTGVHSIAANPLFTNAGSHDFSLQSGSPATGAGFSIKLGIS